MPANKHTVTSLHTRRAARPRGDITAGMTYLALVVGIAVAIGAVLYVISYSGSIVDERASRPDIPAITTGQATR